MYMYSNDSTGIEQVRVGFAQGSQIYFLNVLDLDLDLNTKLRHFSRVIASYLLPLA